MSDHTFPLVEERPNIPGEEEVTLAFWRKIDAFRECLRRGEGRPPFHFFDGPPFATGLPHYGHILAGTVKDVVTRYANQRGFYVPRRFGWDCHGLPVEYEIDTKLGIKHRNDVVKMGIDKYNEECRSIVMTYAAQWREVVERMGRWVDFDNDYKTLDRNYMESVWWVVSQLFEKGLIYRDLKVMPFSIGCNTPLSNFEANLDYQMFKDPSIIVEFMCAEDPTTTRFLAWTTTPWTLPSNLTLCVHPDFIYIKVRVRDSGESWILAEERLQAVAAMMKLSVEDDLEVIERFAGISLRGRRYIPLFDYFCGGEWVEALAEPFRILVDNYVTADTGTGIVHQAPAFGEDDHRCCYDAGILTKRGQLPCPVDDNGAFTSDTPDLNGKSIAEANKLIRAKLRGRGQLLMDGDIEHSVPFCWRSGTPLIYRAVPCWFVRVEAIKDRLIAANAKTYWVPAFVKEKRFHNWLVDARDWCISRNRFWGTPLPLWTSKDFTQVVCIGSVSDLEKHAGHPLSDIHRHFIDDIEIPDPRGPEWPKLKRVDEVLDCWFESGSMPYGQLHYPFENKEEFGNYFPADFIGEGLDQTRGWFYTLMVLGVALFDKPAFKNLVVNGLILAADGKKMSKRLRNYADPMDIVKKCGADAIRLYLVNSPAVRADSLRFKSEGVTSVVRDVLLPWHHALRFLTQEAGRYETVNGTTFRRESSVVIASTNVLDKWILASLQSLISFFHEEMAAYRLYTVTPALLKFLDDLTNWYVRLNRNRMKGDEGQKEAHVALCILLEVLLGISKLMAPFAPFAAEKVYQVLRHSIPEGDPDRDDSVHYLRTPDPDARHASAETERRVARMQKVIVLARTARERKKVGVKTPMKSLKVIHGDEEYCKDVDSLVAYVQSELNALDVSFSTDVSSTELRASPNFASLGPRLGGQMKRFDDAIRTLAKGEIKELEEKGKLVILGEDITVDDVILRRTLVLPSTSSPALGVEADSEVVVVGDFTADREVINMAQAREVVRGIQALRKRLKLTFNDEVTTYIRLLSSSSSSWVDENWDYMKQLLRKNLTKWDKDDDVDELRKRIATWAEKRTNEDPTFTSVETPDAVADAQLVRTETSIVLVVLVRLRGGGL